MRHATWLLAWTFVLGEATKEIAIEVEPSLAFVHVVWRHGDRSPAELLHDEEERLWPNGLGELTNQGIAQQYRLGQWLWKRYGKWLGSPVDKNLIYVRSSDYNRTLMSALANLAGMLPPDDEPIEGLHWQPVPVHTVPKYLDRQLYENIECRVAEQEMANELNSARADALREKHAQLLQYIGTKAGLSVPLDILDVWLYFDNFLCQEKNNKSWPEWLDKNRFDQLTRLYYDSSKLHFSTETLKKLRGGTLLKEIVNRLRSKEDGTSTSNKKYYAYSAHDTTIAALLATLGIDYDIFPLYATAVMVELHRQNGESFIKIVHKNGTDIDTVYEYSIPNCPEPCRFATFSAVYQKYFPSNWESECGVEKERSDGYLYVTIAMLIASVAFLGYLLREEKLKIRRLVKGFKSDGAELQLLASDDDD